MKRKILFVLSIIVSTVLLTGCDMPFSKKGNPNVPDGGHLYEVHVYNSSDALQTLISGMDIVAIYDKNGEFVSLEYSEIIKDRNEDIKSESNKNEEYGSERKIYKDGKDIINYTKITKKSIDKDIFNASGVITDSGYIEEIYNKMTNNDEAKKYVNELIERNKGNDTFKCDDKNYAILDGKKTCW